MHQCLCVCVQTCLHAFLRVIVKERLQAMELWQTAAQELDLLQQTYQKNISDGQMHDTQRQQLKVQYFGLNMHMFCQ